MRTTRDRAGYEFDFTRDDLLADRFYADPTSMQAIVECTIDGVRAGGLKLRRRNPSRFDSRLALKDIEFNIAAGALVREGEEKIAFTTGERPDWSAVLSDGRRVGIEVTEVNASADFANRVIDIDVALREGAAARGIGSCYADFFFGARAFAEHADPIGALNRKARAALVDAMLDFVEAGEFGEDRPPAPALRAFDIMVNAKASSDYPHVSFSAGASSFSSMDAFTPAVERINTKLKKAQAYAAADPLWLILHVTDTAGEFAASIDAIGRGQLSGGAFERIIITDGKTTRSLRRV